MTAFLDINGVQYLKTKLDQRFVQQESGKSLSTNDFTNEYKAKIDRLTAPFNLRGQVDNVSALPQDNVDNGDVYIVSGSGEYQGYIYLGSEWRQWEKFDSSALSYGVLQNKPQIRGVTLEGNKTAQDLGLAEDTAVVHKTGAETIAGAKTFSDAVTVNAQGASITIDRANTNAGYIEMTYNGTRAFVFGKGSSTSNTIHMTAGTGYSMTIAAPSGVSSDSSWTFSGVVSASRTPSAGNDVANKAYVDTSVRNKLDTTTTTAQTVTSQVSFRGKSVFGVDVRLGYGGSTVTFAPEDNTQKTLALFHTNTGSNCYFILDLGNKGKIKNSISPTDDADLANKKYVDDAIATINTSLDSKVDKATTTGQTIASALTLSGAITLGSTFSAGGTKLTQVGEPTEATDAATKQYVDKAIQAIPADTAISNSEIDALFT